MILFHISSVFKPTLIFSFLSRRSNLPHSSRFKTETPNFLLIIATRSCSFIWFSLVTLAEEKKDAQDSIVNWITLYELYPSIITDWKMCLQLRAQIRKLVPTRRELGGEFFSENDDWQRKYDGLSEPNVSDCLCWRFRCWFGKRAGVYTDYIYQGPMILVLVVRVFNFLFWYSSFSSSRSSRPWACFTCRPLTISLHYVSKKPGRCEMLETATHSSR